MTDNLNIIKSKVVSSDWDAFWQQHTAIEELEKNTVVLSTPYQAGSQEQMQLFKMLGACNLYPEDFHIIHIKEGEQIAWHQLRDKIKPKQVIICGIMPVRLGISAMFRFNEPNRFNDCIFIPTLSLPELEKNPEAKKQLWLNALKPVYIDKQFETNR
jgi:hypothetical protein